MNRRRPAGPLALLTTILTAAFAVAALPVLDDKPLLQVDPGGPTAAVTALAFSPDGDTLYVGGLDKFVRVWKRHGEHFELERTLHVPIGPGTAGAINALALSDDGEWLAVAGRAPMRDETGFQRTGTMLEAAAISPKHLEDAGVIYVVPTAHLADGKVLRGHHGEVRALTFAPTLRGQPPLLASTATERAGTKRFGGARLWNVATGKLVAERHDLPEKVEPPPGLAVWWTGDKTPEVRVAIAWSKVDGNHNKVDLRVWDPTADAANALERYEADYFTRPLALLASGAEPRLLVGGISMKTGSATGRLQLWALGDKMEKRDVATFELDGKLQFSPDAIVPVSAKANGTLDHAVVVLHASEGDDHLALIDLDGKKIVAHFPLAKSDRNFVPLLAAGPRGRFVAVADAADHTVQLYAVADLLRLGAKATPSQTLASTGLTPRRVAFVDKGRGLWLGQDKDAKPLVGGLYFDFEERRLRANDGDALATDTPARGDWNIQADQDAKTVRVRDGDKQYAPLVFKDRSVATAAAVRPADATTPTLLAVAYTDRDNARTLIGLYIPNDDPKNPRFIPIRLLIAHLQDVRQLAFSKSRPLLASVADDQTTCVWSLTDLNKAIGQIGGLGLADDDGKAVIHHVEAGSDAAKAGLATGDTIEAFAVPDGKAVPVKSAAEFLLAVSFRRPGDKIELTIKGKREPVTAVISRGVEGSKPLFTLFLNRTKAGVGWVGWSPIGPYDASGDDAEACVGWHTNTGNAAAPVDFVGVAAHRKEYYKDGILALLAEEGDLNKALKRWEEKQKPPEPVLFPVRPPNAAQPDKQGVYLIRTAVPALHVGINADFPLTDAHLLKWAINRADSPDVAATGTATRTRDGWEADLSAVQWRRGDYVIRIALHDGGATALTSKSLTFRFLPPAPTLAVRVNGKETTTSDKAPLKVMDDKLAVELLVSATPKRKVELSYTHALNRHEFAADKLKTVEAGMDKEAVRLEQQFTLKKGVNHLILQAVNEGAQSGHEAEETTTADLWLDYAAPKELPPRITFHKTDRAPEVKTLDKKSVWVVDQPKVHLDVRVEADGPLTLADWTRGTGDPTSVLPATGAGKELLFGIDLDLKVNAVVPLRFRASSKNSEEDVENVAIVYHPPLPLLRADPTASPDTLDPKVTLTGTFKSATLEPFTIVVRVTPEQGSSREAKEFKAELDRDRQAWRASLTLQPGRNKVEAFVKNEWRGEEPAPGVQRVLRFRRPPRIVEAKGLTSVEKAVLDVPLTVESPVGMPLRLVTIDGRRYYDFKATPGAQNAGFVTWQVVVQNVPVADEGRKLEQLSILAHNDDGPNPNEPGIKPTLIAVTHKMLPKPAVVHFDLPEKEGTVPRPTLKAPFRVFSESKLVSAIINLNDHELYRADLTKVKEEAKRFELADAPTLTLAKGPNRVDLIVKNEGGGESRASATITFLEPSVTVTIDTVELRDDAGKVEKLERTGKSDEARFAKAPRSLVWVKGHVTWSNPDADQLDAKDLSVVVLVSGSRQFPVALGPRDKDSPNIRRFEVPAVLVAEDNPIEVEVKAGRTDADQSVAQNDVTGGKFSLACDKPTKDQRLHLLIVGVNVTDGQALTKRVLDTLGAKDRPSGLQGDFKTPAFDRCILYRVLYDYVDRDQVEGQLVEINGEIDRLRRESKWLNDVILIYYQGEDVIKGDQRWLKTSDNLQYAKAAAEKFAIPCHALPRAKGVQLLLLNVVGAPESAAQRPGSGTGRDTALLRYASETVTEVVARGPVVLKELERQFPAHPLGQAVKNANETLKKKEATLDITAIVSKALEPLKIGKSMEE